MSAQVLIAVLIGVAASVEDLARRRISNWIPIAALLAGLVCNSIERGWTGALAAVAGAACGFGVFLIFYLLGGMGGGDVKLMAGFGAVLGAGRILEASLWTAALGGMFALIALVAHALKRWWRPAEQPAPVHAIPYAPAIAMGAWLSLVPKG